MDMELFSEHIRQEEHFQHESNERLREGNERMARIEEDLRPLKNLYHAVVGASVLGTCLVALILFIYSNDRSTLQNLGEAVQRQGVVLEKLIAAHQELEKDTVKEFTRIEKTIEALHRK